MNVFRSALSLTIFKDGKVSDSDIDEFLERYREKKGIVIARDQYKKAIDQAAEYFSARQKCLFICTESRCLEKIVQHPAARSLKQLEKELGCHTETTGCHWQCEYAPVVTLKTGARTTLFKNCHTEEKWEETKLQIKETLGEMQK